MSVTQFRLYPEPPRHEGGWRNQEIAEFYRIADIMAQAGLAVEAESGTSDEGDPWFIFVRVETGDVIAHFARIDGLFVAASALTQEVFRGADVRHVIDQMLKRHPLMVPRRPNGARLLLHPSVVLTAFVAAAFVMASDDAQAHTLDDVLQTTFGGPDDVMGDPRLADGAVIAPYGDAPGVVSTARKPAVFHSEAQLEPGAERSTGNQLALISALIMACDLAARETATTSDARSGLDLLGAGPLAATLSSHPVPSISDPEIAMDWASSDRERAFESGDSDALITTITFTNQFSDKVEGVDESIVNLQAGFIANAQTTAINAAGSPRDDVIVFAVGEDVLMGGGAHDRPTPHHLTDTAQATSQAAASQLDGQQSNTTVTGTSMILVDLVDLVGAAQSHGRLSLDAFVTSFGLPHDEYGIDLVFSQMSDDYETLVSTLLTETEGRSADDAGDGASSTQRASAPVPTKGKASSSPDDEAKASSPPDNEAKASSPPDNEAAAADPSDNAEAAPPATIDSKPASSTPQAPTAIGHLLRQGEARSLVLTDAIDVLLYEGGDVTVHNFELGKDRLWFYLDADVVSAASYHIGTDGDLVMEFSSGETLTLHEVLAPDAPYTFV